MSSGATNRNVDRERGSELSLTKEKRDPLPENQSWHMKTAFSALQDPTELTADGSDRKQGTTNYYFHD